MINKYLSFSLFAGIVFVFTGCSASRVLVGEAHTFENHPVLDKAIVGVSLFDTGKQEFIFEYNANKRFVPASNTKLLTTYAALKYLPDHLPGWFIRETPDTLFMKPNGDPTLFHPEYEKQHLLEYLAMVHKPVVVELEGEPAFSPLGAGWSWTSFQSNSFPERSQLPMYANRVRFKISEGEIQAFPSYFESQLRVDGTLPESDGRVSVTRAEYANEFVARAAKTNRLQRPFTQRTEPNIGFVLLTDTLLNVFPDLHLSCKWVDGKIDVSEYSPLYTYSTDEILGVMMKRSDNFMAEQLLMMVGTVTSGRLSDRLAIRHLMRHDFAGMSDKPAWADGSGLSRNNMMSPRFFVELLRKMEADFGWDKVTAVLPHGNQGTMRGLYQRYENQIFAKTGTLSATVALSGYLVTNSGKRLVFSFLVNNQEAGARDVRKAIEEYLEKIIESY